MEIQLCMNVCKTFMKEKNDGKRWNLIKNAENFI